MKVVRADQASLAGVVAEQATRGGGLCIAVGCFDGIHVGHRRILREVLERAKASGSTSAVLSFDPHPMSVTAGGRAPKLLMTLDDKALLLQEMGLDCLVLLRFDAALRQTAPERFVELAFGKGPRPLQVFVGYNFTFGRNASGTAGLMEEMGKKYGFGVRVVEPVKVRGMVVSSTMIRRSVAAGQLELAEALLGRPYSLRVLVERAEGRRYRLLVRDAEMLVLPPPGSYRCALLPEVGGGPVGAARPQGAVAGTAALEPPSLGTVRFEAADLPEEQMDQPGSRRIAEGTPARLFFTGSSAR